jgi:asparagine synthase (glutamine-hydrolysing)
MIAGDDQRAAANVRELLRDAVMRHLVADVPVGVFLSGGIDSTVIAAFARDYTPRITAFTVGFGAFHGVDEVEQAQATARELEMPHIAVSLDASNLPEKWCDWLAGMDSPSVDGFNTYVVSRRLAAEGVVVGLSGLGADELFGGYSTFRRVKRLSAVLPLLRLIPRSLWRQATAGFESMFRSRSNAEKFVDLIVGDTRPAGVARSLRRLLSDSRIAAMFTSAQPQEALLDIPEIDADPNGLSWQTDAFNGVSRSEMLYYMGNTLLRDTDANSMRHSLEVRVPFLDLALVDYVSALHGRVKNRCNGKYLLRKAVKGTIPAHVTSRPKTGFTLPIGHWMRHEMRESCEAALANLVRQAPLEPREVDRLWQLFIDRPEATGWLRPMALVALGNYLK